MTLDPRPSDADLLALAAKRSEKRPPSAEVRVVIPYEHLVPDNQKYAATVQKGKARLFLSGDYREAKDTIGHIARRAMDGRAPYDCSLVWHAKLFVPDNRRRDATNYAKLTQDSLQGSVYLDDTQIKKATWEHCGVDRENPRVEITIGKLEAA
jgi:Holliday junction resolvase RusA-like endonuclease